MLDIIWIITAAAFVLLMQAGFTCLETGLVRSKNSINVAIKNLMDLCLSSVIFFALGYGIMFGSSSNGLFGTSGFFLSGDPSPKTLAFFIFQMMFCGTAITIVSGAVAERMSFIGYMLVSAITSVLVYPVIGHWAWAGVLQGSLTGWLGSAGFIDFAGATVVHSVGGWVALAAIIIIGPRTGRFNPDGDKIQGSNLTISVLGVLLLWFGWFGFNAGSTLEANNNIRLILVNTCLAAAFGGLSALIVQYKLSRTINVLSGMNGILGGLVAITASCYIMQPLATVAIAIIAGIIIVAGEKLLENYQIDDAIGVIPVHLFCGIWGSIAFVFLSDIQSWGTALNFQQQLSIQLLGVTAIGVYSFCVSYICFKLLNHYYPLRVSLEDEHIGLNVSEHHAKTVTLALFNEMENHWRNGDFSKQVSVEPFTEAGQIAKQYNQVLARVNDEIKYREDAINSFKTSESRRGAILATSLDCIITIDKRGIVHEFNHAAEKCFGYSRQRIINRNFIEYFIPIEKQQDFQKNLDKYFSIDTSLSIGRHNIMTLKRMHEVEFTAEVAITEVTLKNQAVTEFNLHIRDISQQIKQQQKITRMAYHDSLTGLYNRGFFVDKLQQEIDFSARHETSVILMFLDLDQFKRINDNLGHEAGDTLLQAIAQRLKSYTRNGDIICRWGGDEFIICFPNMSKQSTISQKAEDILSAMRKPYPYEGRDLTVQASIGIAIGTNGKHQPAQLVQQADMALYAAKDEGKNTFCFFMPEMQEKENKKFYYEAELRSALEKEQFFIAYQPKVNCQNNGIQSMEALLRWNHPDEGLISPEIFIPILEESSLITEVSQWVLEQVCHQIAQWKAQKLCHFYIAVNLSGRDFLLHNIDQKIKALLQQYNIESRYLELEITETVLANNTEECIIAMHKIKKLGVKLAIDDFGIGYSSMSYLKQFPIDTLKIDKSFIEHCATRTEDSAICTAIIALAKSLNLQVVAEGVETESQLMFLNKQQCDMYQGYLFSHPLPIDEIQQLLFENNE
ncbi:MAG: ammonium transporter [Methyloprofundus sp.]|nr:ammonium transporter [Methyloprofundus sp.]